MTIEEEIRQLIESSDAVDFSPYGQGVSDEWIMRAEQNLGFKLPPSYRWWLKNFGGGEIHGEEIYSVYEIDDVKGGGDIVYMHDVNLRNGTAQVNELFVSEPSGDESFYFRLDEGLPDGEFPIYVFDYVNNEHQKYADNFFEFLKKRI